MKGWDVTKSNVYSVMNVMHVLVVCASTLAPYRERHAYVG